jgi:LGFP repeat
MAVELRAGVGTGRPNKSQDVATVQFFLGVAADGVFGGGTSAALASFQTEKLGFTDGFVDPCDITFKMLRGDIGDSDSALVRATVLTALADPVLGPSAIDEIPSADGQGLVTTWQHGDGIAKIYSHRSWGTWEVLGLILSRYLELKEDRGPLGMPISGERDHGVGGRISFFEHGRIVFDPGTGTAVETIVPD